ncbi:hypothetical protein RND81_09G228300 [Saponaria officinalis]|uniref:Uncharacterized protein n=1 Tax=Saponaria officinalis TaxID=3572 RepID=A0AAW1IQB5_SAPOF
MLRTFTAWRHHIATKRKSPKVADETMFPGYDTELPPVYDVHEMNQGRQSSRAGLVAIYAIFSIPLSILSWFSSRHGNAADGIWVTGDMMRTTEVDHLMVSDGMRYAILM